MNEEKLLELKKEIDEAKTEISELKGSKTQLMKDLKGQWNCTTLEEAKKKYAKGKEDIADIDKRIEKGVEELNEKYEL
ncbi:MAG TPA: hypothetical protein ENH82_17890 [bacterium]|nr:hypothetical protein [bacterium]